MVCKIFFQKLHYGQLSFCSPINLTDLPQVDLALDEISYLQDQGPSEQDVLTVLEIEQRAHENGLQVYF